MGGDICGFLEVLFEYVLKLVWNIVVFVCCFKLVIVVNWGYVFGVGFEILFVCDFCIVLEMM